ncbi:thermonuclease family protein [Alcaligenaceae bacterium CGII-47]|nr:thermonuclease family protein [Alcaligenaceae bacterium CGII-47]
MQRMFRRLANNGVGSVLVMLGLAFGISGTTLLAYASDRTSQSYTLTGRVVNVADGDTFTLLVGRKRERIRMASIDAPETSHGSGRPGQNHAQASRKALAGWIAGQTFTLHCYEHDRYGRNICDVSLADGSTVNQKMVAEGWVWANRQGRDKYLRDRTLLGLEAKAREQGLGLWERHDAVAPWVWRYQCWQQGRCE